jgi:hypothetical protein
LLLIVLLVGLRLIQLKFALNDVRMNDDLSKHGSKKFGDKWNKHVFSFHVYWDSSELLIERPFSSKQMTLNRTEAENLREALNQFLEGVGS